MIIVRTPYRVSFFGGGTDLPAWYEEHGGAVLSTAVGYYSWLTCRYLPPFFSNKNRVVWSKMETPDDIMDIEHPAVRAALADMGFGEKGLEITVLSDLPARAGLGSSSTFAVGLLSALHTLRGETVGHKQLAKESIRLEREILQEAGGIQDQIAAAFGGLNHITFKQDGDFTVSPIIMPVQRKQELQDHMMLFFSGQSRSAAKVEEEKTKALKAGGQQQKSNLHEMAKLVDVAKEILVYGGDLNDFGKLLHETWLLKRGLAAGVSGDFIDDMYDRALKAGATGGKLLGAGGGGFFLIFAKPEYHAAIKMALRDLIYVPFAIDNHGTQIVMNDQKLYGEDIYERRDYIHLKKTA